MKILVTVASKYGATREIGDRIAAVLADAGHEVDRRDPETVGTLDGVDAVVLGSAVYAGHWRKDAIGLVERLAGMWAERPVWLFSSGPVGDPAKPDEDPVDVADMLTATAAREHHVFAGKIVKKQLSFPERAIVAALKVPEGDYRDWDDVETWAASIASALAT
jgi:menaquinone-dependent protoporphyrinogen oxidase